MRLKPKRASITKVWYTPNGMVSRLKEASSMPMYRRPLTIGDISQFPTTPSRKPKPPENQKASSSTRVKPEVTNPKRVASRVYSVERR